MKMIRLRILKRDNKRFERSAFGDEWVGTRIVFVFRDRLFSTPSHGKLTNPQGFKYLYPKFTIMTMENINKLPESSTCANTLRLPDYLNKSILKAKLIQAIKDKSGFYRAWLSSNTYIYYYYKFLLNTI